MREEIARFLADLDGEAECSDSAWKIFMEEADQILTLIRAEIEKVENPYPITTRYDDPRYMDRMAHECYEECRQTILDALEVIEAKEEE